MDEVFKLAGFNVVSVDWVHAFTTGKVEKDPADILLDRPQKERPRTAQLASLCMTASNNPLIQSSSTTFARCAQWTRAALWREGCARPAAPGERGSIPHLP